MSELVAFLEARLADDEAVARAATGEVWDCSDEHGNWPGATPAWCVNDMRDGKWVGDIAHLPQIPNDENDATHIARHDPARVLREVTAKRAILALCIEQMAKADALVDDQIERSFNAGAAFVAHNVLRALAAPFSDHPDFQEQWR